MVLSGTIVLSFGQRNVKKIIWIIYFVHFSGHMLQTVEGCNLIDSLHLTHTLSKINNQIKFFFFSGK